MRYSIALIVAVLIVLGGCKSRPDGAESPAAASDTTDASSDRALAGIDTADAYRVDLDRRDAESSGTLGISLRRLIDRAHYREPDAQELSVLDGLSKPKRVSTEAQPNRHVPGQTDTLRTLHYEDARITVYHVSHGKELLHSIALTGPNLESPEGLRVGMTRADVESALGEPPEHQNGAYIYLQNGPMPRRFYVHFDNDVVGRMEWMFPID